MTAPKKDFMMPFIVIIGIFILTLLLNASIMPQKRQGNYVFPQRHMFNTSARVTNYNGSAHVYVIDQTVGSRISLLSVSLKNPGFVVIKDAVTDDIVASSSLLAPGLYTGGSIETKTTLSVGQKLVAQIFTDNGDGTLGSEDKKEDISSTFVILDSTNSSKVSNPQPYLSQ